MKGYMYEITIKERGYEPIPLREYTDCQIQKLKYVLDFLRPAVSKSKCGWDNLDYQVMRTPSGITTEFVTLWAGQINESGSRWINVTGDSLGSIFCVVAENLW